MKLHTLFKAPKPKRQRFADRPVGRSAPTVSDDEWIESLRQADKGEEDLRMIVQRLMTRMQGDVRVDQLTEAYERGHSTDVLEALPFDLWHRRWKTYIQPEIFLLMVLSADKERRRLYLRHLPNAKSLSKRAEEVSEQLATTVTEQTREAIKYLAEDLLGERHRIQRANRQGFAAPKQRVPPDVAAIITRDAIGMNRRQIAGYGNRINQGIDEERDPLDVKEENNWYVARQWDNRTTQIARTQAMFAVNEGEYQEWQRAYDAGEFDRDKTWLYWIAIGDDKVCEECNALDGTRRKLNNDFSGATHPPLHVGCRCVLTIHEPASTYRQRQINRNRRAERRFETQEEWDAFLAEQDDKHVYTAELEAWIQEVEQDRRNAEMKIWELEREYDYFDFDDPDDFDIEDIYAIHEQITEMQNEVDYLTEQSLFLSDQKTPFINQLYGTGMYDELVTEYLGDAGDSWYLEDGMNTVRSLVSMSGHEVRPLKIEQFLPYPGGGEEHLGGYYTLDGTAHINAILPDSAKYHIMIHEAAHHLEYDMNIIEAEIHWYDSFLRKAGYSEEEAYIAIHSSVFAADVPVYEEYAKKINNPHASAELFTTGLDQFARDPDRFKRNAPEHYEFTVWAMSGANKIDGKYPWELDDE